MREGQSKWVEGGLGKGGREIEWKAGWLRRVVGVG